MKTKVVVVDDSALVRKLLTEIINRAPDLRVVGAAPDPLAAREMIRALDPDVVTLDVEMPRMDGLEFLDRLMRLRPTPVVMVSSLTERGAEVTLRALELGAVDFVAKPKIGIQGGLEEAAAEICDKIRIAAKARIGMGQKKEALERKPIKGYSSTEKIIVIGASTGGTEAIKDVLAEFPADCPATLITQHMPPGFTRSFAARLDGLCRIRVKEAQDGERVLPGHAYIAPGGMHLALARSGANYSARLDDGPPVNRHKPSVEMLFRSAAAHAAANTIAVMLTGMGKDGAQAMRELHDAGAYTLCQDEASCVVFGMPREAIELGAADEVRPLDEIAARVFARLGEGAARAVRV